MSIVTHPSVIRLRNALRAVGLTKALSLVMRKRDYEEDVDKALLGSVRAGDVVWDVGANVGHYSVRLAEVVGPQGRVYAFEPSAVNRLQLTKATCTHANISIMPYGLSSAAGRLAFAQGEDQIGATSRLVRDGDGSDMVELRRGDALVSGGDAKQPDAIKVDVEGHELDVIEGLGEVLDSPQLRALVVEVHFGLLAKEGRADVPGLIEQRLAKAGFRLSWIDSSHLLAVR